MNSNIGHKSFSASKRGERWGSHGKRGKAADIDAAFLRKLNAYLRPESPMYSSVIEAFEANRREPYLRLKYSEMKSKGLL